MKPAVRWTALAALALILVMVAGAAAVATFGLDALRPVVVRNLSEAIDRPVSIEGDLGLGWDQGPVLTAAGITVAGAQNTPPLLEAGRVELCLAGDAVLGGRLVITALALSDVVVRPGSYGGTSRTRLHEPEPSAPVDLSVLGPDARLDLTDVTVLTGGNAPPMTIRSLELAMPDGTTAIGASFAYGEAVFDLDLAGGGLDALLAGSTWPLTLGLKGESATIDARGTLTDVLGGATLDLDIEAGGDNLDRLLASLGLESGIEEPFSLTTGLAGNLARVDLADLHLVLGEIEGSGDLRLLLATGHPALGGSLTLDALPASRRDGEVDLAALLDMPVPYAFLERLDLDLDLAVAHHDLGGLVLDDLSLPLRLQQGHLIVDPLRFGIDGEPLTGRLEADAERNEIALSLQAERVPLAELLQRWRPEIALTGDAGRLSAEAHSGGATVRDLLAGLQLDLSGSDIAMSAQWRDGSASRLALDSLTIDAGTDHYLTARASGMLDGNPASLFLTSGSLRDLFAGTDGWPLEMHLGNSDAGVDLVGVVMHPDTLSGLRLEGLLRATDIARIGALLAIDLPLKGRVESYFHLSDTQDGMRLDWIDATVGQSSLNGTLDIVPEDGAVAVTGSLDAPVLAILTDGGSATPAGLDTVQIEPGDLDGIRLDIAATVGLLSAEPVQMRALDARVTLADGVLRLEDAGARVFGAQATLAAMVDAAANPPDIAVSIAASDIDPHDIGNNLGLQDLMTGHIDRIALDLRAQGTSLRQFAQAASGDLTLEGGTLQIGSDAVGLEFRHLELIARPDAAITGSEDITIGTVPIRLDLRFVPLVDLLTKPSPWLLEGRGDLLGVNFEIARSITPSLEVYAHPVAMRLEAEDLRTALADFGIAMPRPLPLSTHGTVQVFEDRVAFQLEDARLADSDLAGSLEFSFDATPPAIRAAFVSDLVAIDDFLEPADAAPSPAASDSFSVEDSLATALPSWSVPPVDLNLRVDARRMHWSGNDFENVGTRIVILGDTLHIDELQARMFGGSVAGTLSLQPSGAATRATAALRVDHIDSDKLMRMSGIAEAASGELAVELGLDSRGATVAELLGAVDGYATVARGDGWIKSGAIAVLTKDILSALLSSMFDPGQETPIRCIVANVDFDHGKGTLGRSAIALDNVVIVAQGGLDLGRRTIDIELDPKAIDWSFLRLLTPVYVEGSLLDPDVSPRTGEILTGLGAALFGAGPIYEGDLGELCAGT